MILPKVPSLDLISERLPSIFPEGAEHRGYCIRDMAAKTIYVMFYVGAIEGLDRWLRPSQVTDMSNAQSVILNDISRELWTNQSLSNNKPREAVTWYKSNSREPIRDETIRIGLIPCKAVIERDGLPTTSSKPKYALSEKFAALFDDSLSNEDFINLVNDWQKAHLSKSAMARLHLMKHITSATVHEVEVKFPNGEMRKLSAGPSSIIAKAVIEVFATKFLKQPAVLWLSESGNKVVAKDDQLAKSLGLVIDPKKALPDIILIDMGVKEDGSEMLVVFIEVVATDGPINRARKVTLKSLATEAGFEEKNLAFLTAYLDRSSSIFKKNVADLAWGSNVWFVSEPDNVIQLIDSSKFKLNSLDS